MSIDLEAIRARAEAATPVVFIGVQMRKENIEFFEHAKDDMTALLAEVERQAAEIAAVTAERDAARERLCYTCNNGNPGAGIKHSASCDICPWRGQKGEAND